MVVRLKMMRMRVLSTLVVAAGLMGCDGAQKNEARTDYIAVSAVPLLQQTLASGVPLFQGKPNATIMGLVCNYVSGSLSKAQFEQYFNARNVDVNLLAEKDAGFKFIAHGDMNSYAQGCASYIAAKIFSPTVFFAGEGLTAATPDQQLLQERLAQLTPTAVQVTQYIAGLAAQSAQGSYASVAEYKAAVRKRIADTAHVFISSVMQEKVSSARYQPGGEEAGYHFAIDKNNIVFYLNGAPWLGNGVAMGTNYTVKIKNNINNPAH